MLLQSVQYGPGTQRTDALPEEMLNLCIEGDNRGRTKTLSREGYEH